VVGAAVVGAAVVGVAVVRGAVLAAAVVGAAAVGAGPVTGVVIATAVPGAGDDVEFTAAVGATLVATESVASSSLHATNATEPASDNDNNRLNDISVS
jgi:hypothetical protein